MSTFTCDDLERLGAAVADAWRAGRDRDWSVPAGTLTWTCAATASHAIDCVLAPAFFLASRLQDHYPVGGWSIPDDATPDQYVEGLETATRVTVAVVRQTPPDVRSIIWRRPQPELRGPADFPPRSAVELALHAHDVCAGLGVPFAPPEDVADRLRRHVVDWPYWSGGPPWSPLALTGDPWADLLSSSGRA